MPRSGPFRARRAAWVALGAACCAARVLAFAPKLAAKGVLAGLNDAGAYGADVAPTGVTKSTRYGAVAGVFATVDLAEEYAVQPEVLFSVKGYRTAYDLPSATIRTAVRFDYLDVPVLAKYRFPGGGRSAPCAYAGPAFGFLLAAASETEIGGSATTADVTGSSAGFDLGVVVGAGASLPAGPGSVTADLRYEAGLRTTGRPAAGFTPEIKNAVLALLVGYAW